jgi:hypothetical protein
MERQAISLQRTDMLLHRLLPFGLVAAFLIACIILTFVSPAAGTAALAITMAGVLTAYLTGRTPPAGRDGSDSE